VKLVFLGTRGEIEARTRRHHMHTSLMVGYRGGRVMVDAGEDWVEELWRMTPRPHAIVVTHAHPDHAWGLRDGSPAPVHAPDDAWKAMDRYPIEARDRHRVEPRKPFRVKEITFEAFPVEHSIRAPAVAYRITAGRVTVFYGPDLVYINDRADALRGCRLYIGDGATMTRSFVRRRGSTLIGHAPVRTQLTWCQKEGVPRAIISHCGKEIVEGDRRVLETQLRAMAEERGVVAAFAHDGLTLVLR
jgi:phosphoribosyl 1,2-cyclic phosphodiesterase